MRKIKKRVEVDPFRWATSDILKKDEHFYTRLEKISKKLGSLLKYKGELNNKETILICLKQETSINYELGLLYLYAHMKKDEDLKNVVYCEMYDKIQGLAIKFGSEFSFIVPELSALSDKQLKEFIEDPDFSDYDYKLKEILRSKKHILTNVEENLLAKMYSFSSKFQEIFTMFDNADIQFKKIRNNKGEAVSLTHATYNVILQDNNRDLRKKAYETMFTAYKDHINTLAANYSGNVQKNVFIAKARNYENAMSKALSAGNVDPIVYKNLIKNIDKCIPCLQEYIDFKKEVLGYDKLYFYDLYLPIVHDCQLKLPYREAYELVKKALAPLGQDYIEIMEEAYNKRWVDVYERKHKKSGAYSTGAYGVHPYVLLNYCETTHDIFTIAHEMGHAMHTYYSNKNQPFEKADYEIFVAEVASTVNETLLLEYLIAKKDIKKDMRAYLMTYQLEMFRTTMFRQTLFAEFEQKAHEMAENDLSLNEESLSKTYEDLIKKYYGDNVVVDDLIRYEWARIPHFYHAFYVYKYATGIISASSIAKSILERKDETVENYKKFLSAGCSDSPVKILKIAGVDLTIDKPFEDVKELFSSTLKKLKKEILISNFSV